MGNNIQRKPNKHFNQYLNNIKKITTNLAWY